MTPGRSRAARPPTAPPAWSKRSPPAKGRSATPTPARPKNSQVAKIQVGKSWAEPSPEAAAASPRGVSRKTPQLSNGKTVFAFKSTRKTESEGVYPIVLVSSLIACSEYGSSSEAALVKAYLEYAISPEGQEVAATNAGSAPLSAALTKKITPAVESIKAG